MSREQIPLKTDSDQKYTASVFTYPLSNIVRASWCLKQPHISASFTFTVHLINTRNKMSAVGSGGEMISARSLWMSQSSSDPQPGDVLVWGRSGHHGDETDCIICSAAVWHKGMRDVGTDRQAVG